jgi:hypothetical protein
MEGRPLAGIDVYAGDRADLLCILTETSASGEFSLEGIPSGAFYITANGGELGVVSTELRCASNGDVHLWNPRLGGGKLITGRVRYDDYQAIVGLTIVAVSKVDVRQSATGPSGEFTFDNCCGLEYQVEARLEAGGVLAWARGVRPGTRNLELIARRRTSKIQGRVVNESGNPIGNALVLITLDDASSTVPGVRTGDDGRFDSGPLSDGLYDLHCDCQPYAVSRHAGIRVGANENVDIGDIELRDAGSLIIRCTSAVEYDIIAILSSDDDVVLGRYEGRSGDAAPSIHCARIPVGQVHIEVIANSLPRISVSGFVTPNAESMVSIQIP